MPQTFSEIIRETRLTRGESQEEFGEFLGMSQEWVAKAEAGTGGIPKTVTLRLISERINRPLAELLVAVNLARTQAEGRAVAESVPKKSANAEKWSALIQRLEAVQFNKRRSERLRQDLDNWELQDRGEAK